MTLFLKLYYYLPHRIFTTVAVIARLVQIDTALDVSFAKV